MHWSDINYHPNSRVLRQFAGLWIAFFAAMAFWSAYRGDHLAFAAVLAGLAVSIGSLGLGRPQAIRWVYIASMIVAFPIGWTVSHILLAILFYVVLTPVGLYFRLLGRDELRLRPDPEAKTYWSAKPTGEPVSYLRQY